MKLTVLNSGSDGNCYLLECNGEILILDCGVSLKEVKKALNFDLSHIVGVFISHEHKDHSKYRSEFSRLGVEMFTPYDTGKIRENTIIGGFSLQAFKVPHGDVDNYGLLIRHKNGETILYATDFEYIRYTFGACKVNHFIVECNYQAEYVDLDAPNKEHKLSDHCSLDTVKKFLKENYTYEMENVILVHMGYGSTNPAECVEEVEKVLNPNVVVDYARANEVYELTDKRLPFGEI